MSSKKEMKKRVERARLEFMAIMHTECEKKGHAPEVVAGDEGSVVVCKYCGKLLD
jgi:ribosomal protein S27E